MKNKTLFTAFLAFFCLGASAQTDEKTFLDNLMSKMTIDEKIGQLNLMSSYDFVSAKTVTGKNENEELISKVSLVPSMA